MRQIKAKHAAILAGGLAGLAAIYLLDPRSGERRRQAIADAAADAAQRASDAVHRAGAAAQSLAESAGDRFSSAATQVRDHLGDLAAPGVAVAAPIIEEVQRGQAAHAASLHRVIDKYRDQAHYLADRVDQLRQRLDAPGMVSQAAHFGSALVAPIFPAARSLLGRLRRTSPAAPRRSAILPVISISTAGIICLAAGAGAMYFFDPDRGRARRAAVRDRSLSRVRNLGKFARSRGRHLRNRAQGIASEIGLSNAYLSGEQLLQRVREAMARAIDDPRLIQVMTDTAGIVTLTGEIAAAERDRLLSALQQVPGVREIIDRLRSATAPAPKPTPPPAGPQDVTLGAGDVV